MKRSGEGGRQCRRQGGEHITRPMRHTVSKPAHRLGHRHLVWFGRQ